MKVWPTLFVAGPPKTGSTSLWDCIMDNFNYQTMCRHKSHCDSRFVVSPIEYKAWKGPRFYNVKESSYWSGMSDKKSNLTQYGGPTLDFTHWIKSHKPSSLVNWTNYVKSLCHRERDACSKGYISKSLRMLGETEAYDISALPSESEILKRFRLDQVAVVEGNPGVFMNQAFWVNQMLGESRRRAKFVVGYRTPSDLVTSFYLFAGKRMSDINNHMESGMERLHGCLVQHAGNVTQLPRLSGPAWDVYFSCIYKNPSFVNTGMYGASFLDYFRHGFRGDQFILVDTKRISDPSTIASIVDFWGMPSNRQHACRHLNKGTRTKITIDSVVLKQLDVFFEPYTQMLWSYIVPKYLIRSLI